MDKIPGTAPVSQAAQSAALEAQSLGGLEQSVAEGSAATAPAAGQPKAKATGKAGGKKDKTDTEKTAQANSMGLSGKRAIITLHDSDRIPPGGQFIGLNGVGFLLLPGVQANVPVELLGVLNDAVMTEPVLNERLQVDGYRNVPRLTYTFHGVAEA